MVSQQLPSCSLNAFSDYASATEGDRLFHDPTGATTDFVVGMCHNSERVARGTQPAGFAHEKTFAYQLQSNVSVAHDDTAKRFEPYNMLFS